MKHPHAPTATHAHADADEIRGWFAGRLPDDWFEGAPDVTADSEEVLLVGRLPDAAGPGRGDGDGHGACVVAATSARTRRERVRSMPIGASTRSATSEVTTVPKTEDAAPNCTDTGFHVLSVRNVPP